MYARIASHLEVDQLLQPRRSRCVWPHLRAGERHQGTWRVASAIMSRARGEAHAGVRGGELPEHGPELGARRG